MRIRLILLIVSLFYLSSCASLPANERISTAALTDNGLVVGQFLYIGIDEDGEPNYNYMTNYYPRLVGDAKRNVVAPIDQNGILAFPFKAGNYQIERLRNIDREKGVNVRIRMTRIYSLGVDLAIEKNQVTNLGLIVMANLEKDSGAYYLFTVDNEETMAKYLEDNFSGLIPENYTYKLVPDNENLATKAEMREFLEQAFPAEFLDGIEALK
jgi:hypothetical protein